MKIRIKNGSFEVFTKSTSKTPKKCVIAIHGCRRNADVYLKNIFSKQKDVLFAAPRFCIKKDKDKSMKWSSNDAWIRGNYDLENGISSFEVMDKLIAKIKNKFPSIKKTIVIGHSAGGQFVNRYAFSTHLDENVTFIICNPSSYLYLNEYRLVNNKFVKKKQMNKYKFGLDNVNKYLKKKDLDLLKSKFLMKKVFYTVGELDTVNRFLENTPPNKAQGKNRFDRGVKYFKHMNKYFKHKHKLVKIPKIAHSNKGMFQSKEIKKIMY